MRRLTLTATLAVAGALVVTPAAAAAPSPDVQLTPVSGQVVPGQYLVTLRPGADVHRLAASGVKHVYTHAVTGFAAKLTDDQVRELRRDRDVLAIEPDQVVHAAARPRASQTPTPNWGLDRIDQRYLPLNDTYNFRTTGLGVTAFVIDTGIDPTHPDFGGRAYVAYDATGGDGIDCNGHGTHVAGIVGSTTYGVAKRVRIGGVRVLNCIGSGTVSDIVEGVDWVAANSPGPAVANMSLGGSRSTVMDTAVNNLARSGVFVSVAAGGSGTDACNFSPAGAAQAFAVASSNRTDQAATRNNRGPCVRLYAPGEQIVSTWLGGGTATLSGSSMASPHVAGVAARLKQQFGDLPTRNISSLLISTSTPNVLTNVPPDTPNRLLYARP